MKAFVAAIVATGIIGSPAAADLVQVTATGEVEFNQISAPPLGNVNNGDPAELTFLIDSDVFTDSASFPTRGYHIDPSTFVLTMGAVSIGLQDPFPAGETPYFVLRNNDPMADGFFIATSVNEPIGVPIAQTGIFEQFRNNYSIGYVGDTLSSLDVLDALGTYDFTGLKVFNWTIDDGPFNAMGLIFEQMTIESCACPTDVDGDGETGFQDLLSLLAAWGPCAGCPEDVDGDLEVGFQDLLAVLAAWGPCPCMPEEH